MAGKVKAVPDGFYTVTPHLIIRDAGKAIDFYKKAFGAEEVFRMPGPDGKSVMHAELKIGNSHVMMCDENPKWGCMSPLSLNGSPVKIHLYVENVDASYDRAVKAGATPAMPVSDMFWGDRYGCVKDPFGHEWSMATHVEDVSPEECAKRSKAWFSQQACG
jgi:uncharacterized glyoxalase superfamily protein PhnB